MVYLAYTVHSALREAYPRRLPAFTSLKLLELYAWAAVALAANGATDGRLVQAFLDPKRLKIERRCDLIKRNMMAEQPKNSYERALDAAVNSLEGEQAQRWVQLLGLRTGEYMLAISRCSCMVPGLTLSHRQRATTSLT